MTDFQSIHFSVEYKPESYDSEPYLVLHCKESEMEMLKPLIQHMKYLLYGNNKH